MSTKPSRTTARTPPKANDAEAPSTPFDVVMKWGDETVRLPSLEDVDRLPYAVHRRSERDADMDPASILSHVLQPYFASLTTGAGLPPMRMKMARAWWLAKIAAGEAWTQFRDVFDRMSDAAILDGTIRLELAGTDDDVE